MGDLLHCTGNPTGFRRMALAIILINRLILHLTTNGHNLFGFQENSNRLWRSK